MNSMDKSIPTGMDMDERTISVIKFVCPKCKKEMIDFCTVELPETLFCNDCKIIIEIID